MSESKIVSLKQDESIVSIVEASCSVFAITETRIFKLNDSTNVFELVEFSIKENDQ